MDVQTSGNGSEIVVAVHGIQGTRAVWNPVAQRLGDDFTFVLPNLRGRGAAVRGASVADYGLGRFADDLADIIDQVVAGRPYTLAGWSMGVSVSLAYVTRRLDPSKRPQSLILISGSSDLTALRWFKAHEGAALLAEIAAREQRLGLREAADHNAVACTWRAIRDTSQRSALAGIDLPTLIVHGSADTDSPVEQARWLADGIADSLLQVIDSGGHSLPTEHADAVAAHMIQFLSIKRSAETS
ncbi:alpha/beta hydrolase [Paraburkholderia dipogonis]|uniref:Alpha/beta hydrolase n=1 Tax=Paraburkholderia dipogonis TaxID=1211383 RepID=A0A4Y8MHD2_9BURK|nr:alpha/beta hydrolase [Paraburkholderia dipogonis]TFE36828.1 alpha/beta hydrolase [Paraburkholderia dipogonis]